MKGSSKTAITVTVCGLFAAISVVLMLVSYIGTLSYALAAAAGALLILIDLELGTKYAFTVYFAVSVLSFMLCNKEAALCYTLFFGYYPILKAFIEKLHNKTVQWSIKLAVFIVAFAGVMILGAWLFSIPIDDMGYGIIGIAALCVALVVMFVIYDIALTRIITFYIYKYQEKFRRLLRLNKGNI